MKSIKKYIFITILSIFFVFCSFSFIKCVYNLLIPLEIVDVNLSDGIINASNSDEIILRLNKPSKNLDFYINGQEQSAKVDNKIVTINNSGLCPGKDYTLSVISKSLLGYEFKSSYNFTTAEIDEEMWVEVIREPVNKVNIYKNGKIIKVMLASLGKENEETPKGTFRLENRGEEFFSEKYNIGAKYWVRFKDNYLFHSVPYDENGNLIDEEVLKLGKEASHGCVRLFIDDAKWFYENVPDNTLVVIN